MIRSEVKLRLNQSQEKLLQEWLWILTGVYNWAVRKIEQDAADGVYYSKLKFQNLLAKHSKKLGLPGVSLHGTLVNAHLAWYRCFEKKGGKPKLKGNRNKLSSIPIPGKIKPISGNYVSLPIIGKLRFHKQSIPEGTVKCTRLIKRASGWYLCLFIDADRQVIPRKANGIIGIDPGFKYLLVTSDGEKVDHPKELQQGLKRLGQAQRGGNKKLVARMHERVKNQRKDRNHKLSKALIERNEFIAFSKDNHLAIAKKFGKSVTSAGHGQLRTMLAYKSRAGGTQYVEVASNNSTKTCSTCGSFTGPTGWGGLAVRHWTCTGCGSHHDRDVNAAVNTLMLGLGQPSLQGKRLTA